MSTTPREEIMAEAAARMALWNPEMVNELTDVKGSPRTVFVGAYRQDGVEGIVHILEKRGKYFAKFTSDETYRQRWGQAELIEVTSVPRQECPRCHGSGRVPDYDNAVEDCSACWGEGWIS